jgi:hypothetical protein
MKTLIWHLMCYSYHVMLCVVSFSWFYFIVFMFQTPAFKEEVEWWAFGL